MHLGVVKYSHVILNRKQTKSEGAQKTCYRSANFTDLQ